MFTLRQKITLIIAGVFLLVFAGIFFIAYQKGWILPRAAVETYNYQGVITITTESQIPDDYNNKDLIIKAKAFFPLNTASSKTYTFSSIIIEEGGVLQVNNSDHNKKIILISQALIIKAGGTLELVNGKGRLEIITNELKNEGLISADGNDIGETIAGGGGGRGGIILIRANKIVNNGQITANGGDGGTISRRSAYGDPGDGWRGSAANGDRIVWKSWGGYGGAAGQGGGAGAGADETGWRAGGFGGGGSGGIIGITYYDNITSIIGFISANGGAGMSGGGRTPGGGTAQISKSSEDDYKNLIETINKANANNQSDFNFMNVNPQIQKGQNSTGQCGGKIYHCSGGGGGGVYFINKISQPLFSRPTITLSQEKNIKIDNPLNIKLETPFIIDNKIFTGQSVYFVIAKSDNDEVVMEEEAKTMALGQAEITIPADKMTNTLSLGTYKVFARLKVSTTGGEGEVIEEEILRSEEKIINIIPGAGAIYEITAGPICKNKEDEEKTTGCIANNSDYYEITVLFKDVANNIVTYPIKASGTNVTINNKLNEDTVSPPTSGDKLGQATFKIKTTKSGKQTITFCSLGSDQTCGDSNSFNYPLTFSPGSVSANKSSISSDKSAVDVSEGDKFATVTVTIKDANGNPIANRAVNLMTNLPEGEANLPKIEAVKPITDDNGTIKFKVSYTKAGTVSFYPIVAEEAADALKSKTVSITFNPISPDHTSQIITEAYSGTTLLTEDTLPVADGQDYWQVTANIVDKYGNTVTQNHSITVKVKTGLDVTLDPSSGWKTNNKGQITFKVKSTSFGEKKIDLLFGDTSLLGENLIILNFARVISADNSDFYFSKKADGEGNLSSIPSSQAKTTKTITVSADPNKNWIEVTVLLKDAGNNFVITPEYQEEVELRDINGKMVPLSETVEENPKYDLSEHTVVFRLQSTKVDSFTIYPYLPYQKDPNLLKATKQLNLTFEAGVAKNIIGIGYDSKGNEIELPDPRGIAYDQYGTRITRAPRVGTCSGTPLNCQGDYYKIMAVFKDEFGNVVKNRKVEVKLVEGDATKTSIKWWNGNSWIVVTSATDIMTDAKGRVDLQVASSQLGERVVYIGCKEAACGSVGFNVENLWFVAGQLDKSKSSIIIGTSGTTTSAQVVANGERYTQPIQVTLKDTANNPITGYAVALAGLGVEDKCEIKSEGKFEERCYAYTNNNGIAQFYLSSTKAYDSDLQSRTRTIYAVDYTPDLTSEDNILGTKTVTITFVAGPLDPYNSGVVLEPQEEISVSSSYTMKVYLRDKDDNSVFTTAADGKNLVSFNGFTSSNDKSVWTRGKDKITYVSADPINGIVTYTLSSEQAGEGSLTVTAATTPAFSRTISYIFIAGEVTNLEVSDGGTTSVGTSFNFTVTAKDAKNNPVPDLLIKISAKPKTGTDWTLDYPSLISTDENGQASFSIYSEKAGEKEVTIQAGSLTPVSRTVTFTTGNLAEIFVTSYPQGSVLASKDINKDYFKITITLRDEFGNPVVGDKPSISLSDYSPDTDAIKFYQANWETEIPGVSLTNPPVSDNSGKIYFKIASNKAGSRTISVSVGEISASKEIYFTPGSLAKLEVTPDKDLATEKITVSNTTDYNEEATTVAFEVRALDSNNNPITNTFLTISSTDNNDRFYHKDCFYKDKCEVKNTKTSSFTFLIKEEVETIYLKSAKAGSKTVIFKSGSLSQSFNVTFKPGEVSEEKSWMTSVPAMKNETINQTVGNTITLNINLRDEFNNPIEGIKVEIQSDDRDSVSGTTNNNGFITLSLSGLIQTKEEELEVWLGEVPNAKQWKTLTVNWRPGGASEVVYVLTPETGSVVVSDLNNPEPLTISGQLKDSLGNQLNYPVSLSIEVIESSTNKIDESAYIVSESGTASNPKTITSDENGSFGFSVISSKAGKKKIVIKLGKTILKDISAEFVALSADNQKSFLTASPSSHVINEKIYLTLELKDKFNNPIVGRSIEDISLSGFNEEDVSFFIQDQLADLEDIKKLLTNSEGKLSFSFTSSSVTEKSSVISIDIAETTLTRKVSFVSNQPDSGKSSYTLNKTIAKVGGEDYIEIDLTLRDKKNVPVKDFVPDIKVSGNNFFEPDLKDLITDENGKASFRVYSIEAGKKKVSIGWAGNVYYETYITFIPGTLSEFDDCEEGGSCVEFDRDLTEEKLIVGETLKVIIWLKDEFGNSVANITPTVYFGGKKITVGPTEEDGSTSFSLTFQKVGTYKLKISVKGIDSYEAALTVLPGPPDITKSKITITPTSRKVKIGSSGATITLTLKDKFGNSLKETPIYLTSEEEADEFEPEENITDKYGKASFNVRSTVVSPPEGRCFDIYVDEELWDISNVNGADKRPCIIFTPAPPNKNVSTISLDKTTAMAGEPINLEISLVDQFGNAVSDWPVSLSMTGKNNTFPALVKTNEDGVATVEISSTKAEGKELTVTVKDAFSQKFNLNIVAGVPDPEKSKVQIMLPVGWWMVRADGEEKATIYTILVDKYGNPCQWYANDGGRGGNYYIEVTTDGEGDEITYPLYKGGPAMTWSNKYGEYFAFLSSTEEGLKKISVTVQTVVNDEWVEVELNDHPSIEFYPADYKVSPVKEVETQTEDSPVIIYHKPKTSGYYGQSFCVTAWAKSETDEGPIAIKEIYGLDRYAKTTNVLRWYEFKMTKGTKYWSGCLSGRYVNINNLLYQIVAVDAEGNIQKTVIYRPSLKNK